MKNYPKDDDFITSGAGSASAMVLSRRVLYLVLFSHYYTVDVILSINKNYSSN
jgi:hypothetical protein